VNYDNSLVVTITVTCNLWAPYSGDDLCTCGATYLPPQGSIFEPFQIFATSNLLTKSLKL